MGLGGERLSKGTWHPEALSPLTRKAAAAARGAGVCAGFYLVGGTALALHLGHRFSDDLDFFSPSAKLDAPERARILEALRGSSPQVRHENDGWLQASIGPVPVTFLRYSYPVLKPLLDWDGLAVADVPDIALMKISAIIGRGTRRDFLDLFAILPMLPLRECFQLARRKFPDNPDFAAQASYALTYFEDAEKQPMPRLIKPVDWAEIRGYFEREVPKVFRRLL